MSNTTKAISGGKWITIATAISTILQFGQVAMLARLLDPSAFGIVSVSNLVINFFNIFGNLGFSNSVISKQEEDTKVLSSLYLLNILLGTGIFTCIYYMSPLLASFYKEPKLEHLAKVSAVYFLIVYFGQMHLFILQKNLKFKNIAIIDIIGTVGGTLTTIAFAYYGYGPISLIFGQLTLVSIKTILQITYGKALFSPLLFIDLKIIRYHLRFGLFNVADSVLNFAQSNSDNIAIGGMLGVKTLGYYTIASQLTIFPVSKLNPIILQVAYPLLAKMREDDSELKKAYLKILDLVIYLNLPLLTGLFIVIDNIIPIVYGPGWEPTFELARIFIFVAALFCLSNPLFTIAYSKGRPELLLYQNTITLAVKLPLLYILGRYAGAIGIAYAYLAATLINAIINFILIQVLIGNYFRNFVNNLLQPVLFCSIMTIILLLYKQFVVGSGILYTATQVCIGASVYISLTLLFKIPFKQILMIAKSA